MTFAPTRSAGLARLEQFLPAAGRRYAETRNTDDGAAPGERGNVSELSPWIHAGVLSASDVLDAVLGAHSPRAAEKFIAEVFWRIYFKGYLEQRPAIWSDYCTGRDAALAAVAGNSGLRTGYAAATEGRTGIGAFDVWVHELRDTGYLHNHARMWFASIWIFTLKLDWHLGADFFLRHLMDADAASNTLSWRWVAGLHTQGKHYLARAGNIARYTASRPGGALVAEGLAQDAAALSEPHDYARQPLNLPAPIDPSALEQPFALLLHDEAAHHAVLNLPAVPNLVIGAARPDARSPGAVGSLAADFARGAVSQGVADAAAAFDCPAAIWEADKPLSALIADAGVSQVVLPYLPHGWTRDALWPELAPLAAKGQAITILGDLDRATWPLAKAGFFPVAKAIDDILAECGIAGANRAASTAG
ncbi:FAD-binding domain-containing protein [Erythrobacter sp. R86502]|uniref:FAD-binding domain-containing protein n=1 Tax=Erythrobacter sp. R86502 TaxID=3093846 RepID=UPI0036D3DBFA